MTVPECEGKGWLADTPGPPPATLATLDGSRPPWMGFGAERELPFQLRRTVQGSGSCTYRATVYYLEGRRLATKAGTCVERCWLVDLCICNYTPVAQCRGRHSS